MKPTRNPIAALDMIQLCLTVVMVVTTFHRRDMAIDAEHAQNAALFRIAVLLICIIGTIVVQSIKYVIKRNLPPITAGSPMQNQYQPLPGQREINITYYSTRAANKRCNLYMMFRLPQMYGFFGIFGLLAGYFLAVWVYGLNTSLALIMVPIAFIAGIAAPALFICALIWCALTWFELKMRFPTPDKLFVCTSVLTADGFYDIAPDKTKFVPWSGFKSLREHDGDIYFSTSGMNGSYIPREGFYNLAIAKQFYQDAVGLWKSNGTVWPDGPPGQP